MFTIIDKSERFFINKFGATIYEDILTLEPRGIIENTDKHARLVAISHLQEAINKIHPESQLDLEKAINMIDNISPSPKYNYKGKQ